MVDVKYSASPRHHLGEHAAARSDRRLTPMTQKSALKIPTNHRLRNVLHNTNFHVKTVVAFRKPTCAMG